MNLTLYLTENCNLRCSYCIREKCPNDMTSDTVRKSVDLAFSKGDTAGICFFGGEPLLKKDLICYALDLAKKRSEETGIPFSCKITTNGTLLDEEFLELAKKNNMQIGLSFDGLMQDDCRKTADGGPTSETLEKVSKMIIASGADAVVMCVVPPCSCGKLFGSVKYIHDLGFKHMICNPAYGSKVTWTDEALEVLKEQFDLITDYLKELYLKGDKFRFAPLHNKITENLSGINPSRYCHLGIRQLAVAYDGNLYPCTSFLYKSEWCLGNVSDGVDEKRRLEMTKLCFTPSPCKDCDLSKRCTNSCGCANIMNTGSPDMISPLQCEYERLVIERADRLGDELYKYDKDRFIKSFRRA
ncbi:MAG: radical SAM protein [Clostridiales bacterium]|nr:radical SAM protein [Clostridiales bacterium]